jgi:hypothetical protein
MVVDEVKREEKKEERRGKEKKIRTK